MWKAFRVSVVWGCMGILMTGCPWARPVLPAASFTATPTSGVLPLAVAFTDTSEPGSEAITAWAWDFGDGGTSTEQHPLHTYVAAGAYTVALSVTTPAGSHTSTQTGYVVVEKAVPSVAVWPVMSPIASGLPLSMATLTGGEASVEGAFVFDSPGTILEPGTYTQAVTFMPDDAANYSTVSGTVAVTIVRAYFVKSGASGDGRSWASAFGVIQAAVDATSAAGGGEVWVAAGTYTAATPSDAFVITMAENVHLYGGFAGNEATREARDWETYVTIIDGEAVRTGVLGASNATIDGFTIQHGHAAVDALGGGMYNCESSPTVARCIFSENDAEVGVDAFFTGGGGGGMYNKSASPTVTCCIFTANSLSSELYAGGGAAMYNSLSAPVLADCTFTANTALEGGAVYNDSSDASLTDCVFRENTALYSGGGMYNVSSSPAVKDCTFRANTAVSNGGGMYNDASSPATTHCLFTENTADTSGGGMYNLYSAPTVTGCVFTSNRAPQGAGLANGHDSGAQIANCVFIGNAAGTCGGGVYNYAASPTIGHCTFTENTAYTSGGGVYSEWGSSPSMFNCILWGDSAPEGAECYAEDNGDYPSIPVVTSSCVQGGYSGTGNMTSDPLFVGAAESNGRIQPISPCIDAGTATGEVHTDMLGVARPQGAGVDMGAYELDDSDGDGISDTWEQGMFGSLAVASAGSDADGDGLSDGLESLHATDPARADTDEDGLTDYEETLQGWNPTVPTVMYRVSAANTTGTEDGLSWASAFRAIQTAINAAAAAGEGEVWVAAGTYTGEPADSGYVVSLRRYVHLYGGFSGTETERDARDWETNVTAIDGEGVRRCVCGATGATLDGFVLRNGYASTGGGGMYNHDTSPVVVHCTFANNATAEVGGGVYNASSAMPVFTGCVFIDNTATFGGGAVGDSGAAPSLAGCTFTGNSATYGGAIYSTYYSFPSLADCVFAENTATQGGGLFTTFYSAPSITACTFTGNAATATGGGLCSTDFASTTMADCTFTQNTALRGGGAYSSEAAPSAKGCVFTENTATENGGGLYAYNGSATLFSCTFSGNTATRGGGLFDCNTPLVLAKCTVTGNDAEKGGGMYNDHAGPSLTTCAFGTNTATDGGGICNYAAWPSVSYCTFTGNAAARGGGMCNDLASTPYVIGCTFTENTATAGGGGMCNLTATPAVFNSVFGRNTAGNGGGVSNSASSPPLTNCTFAANTASDSGGGVYNGDASAPVITNGVFWADSASNGNEIYNLPDELGPSVPVVAYSCIAGGYSGTGNISADPLFVAAAAGDYRLSFDSPCVDTGTGTGALAVDILGISRPQGSGYDMGAYEYTP